MILLIILCVCGEVIEFNDFKDIRFVKEEKESLENKVKNGVY